VKLLLDEMHAPVIARTLRDEGFDVMAVAEEPAWRGMADPDLLALCAGEGRAMATENVSDFVPMSAAWHREGRVHAGLVLTAGTGRFDRAASTYPGLFIASLRQFLASPPVGGDSWMWWL
jgi:hypothetical protein